MFHNFQWAEAVLPEYLTQLRLAPQSLVVMVALSKLA